ncbi:two component transcriptional regulator, winged helix family [Magnetococcus marinus MC-1]|uniref:Two component transcriptional regulator, winged helix family n=1 Tax=Magnetococcus marinus (strain ATCC BAA-1437 / JCM 17883 / MC-1) TaxID=156889 RepID=A0LCI2_MAGMM|nr:response regulator transcription factor [Magnetococcus marinus]ABK45675.1 two component transcriptional regulator, winged helix family [Magnetococcus marinus MC-1]
MNTILLVDDDKQLCAMLAEYLYEEGFSCDLCHSGTEALNRALQSPYEALVLDVMLPGINGFDLLRKLRQQTEVPVIMLTARGEETDSIVGLEIGADDYLSKPCNPRVLAARLRAVLRRTGGERATSSEQLNQGALTLYPMARKVMLGAVEIELTSAEFNILEQLLREAGQVVDKERLSQKGLGRKWMPYDRSVDMHISSLRKKLAATGDSSPRIHTLRGSGYLYAIPVEKG